MRIKGQLVSFSVHISEGVLGYVADLEMIFVMYKKATSWKFILRRTKNVGNFILVFLVYLHAQINANVSIKGFILLVLHWYVLLHSSTHCIEIFILVLETEFFLIVWPKIVVHI